MSRLRLLLFGSPQVEIDGTAVEISRHKAVAILAYLAVTGEKHSRDKLAAMFWPESSQSKARASLRRDLSTLNKALGGRCLTVDRDAIGLEFNGVWTDVSAFQEKLAACHSYSQERQCYLCRLPPPSN